MFPPPACLPLAGLLHILRGKFNRYSTELDDCMRWVYYQHTTTLARLNLTRFVENRPARGSGRGAVKHYGIPRSDCAKTVSIHQKS